MVLHSLPPPVNAYAQCTRGLEARCDSVEYCQGTARSAMCQGSVCVYGARIDDDSACVDGLPGAALCGPYKDLVCTGKKDQECYDLCTLGAEDFYCDPQSMCVNEVCVPRTGG